MPDLQSCVIDRLKKELGKSIALIERRNSGPIKSSVGGWGGYAYTAYYLRTDDSNLFSESLATVHSGQFDITGVTTNGRFFAIEIKDGRDKLRESQKDMMGLYAKYHILYAVVRSVEDVDRFIDRMG